MANFRNRFTQARYSLLPLSYFVKRAQCGDVSKGAVGNADHALAAAFLASRRAIA
jgi:hypothetical protein